MNFNVKKGSLTEVKSDLVVVNLFEGVEKPAGATGAVDEFIKGAISNFVIKKEKFEGKFGNMYLLPLADCKNFSKVLIVGLGKQEEFSLNKIREISSKIVQKVKSLKNVKTVTSILHGAGIAGFDAFDCAQMITEGALIGHYSFDKYKSEKDKSELEEFKILEMDEAKYEKALKGYKKGKLMAEAVNFARNLSNEPAMFATPAELAKTALDAEGVDVEIYDKDEIESMGMKAFLAVGKGSSEPPKFIHMKYTCNKPKKKIAIIGKGVTFDSGGLDIKPPSSMLNMKDDMSAAAAIISIMHFISKFKPDIEVHGLVAACENMPGNNAYKPGDVLTAKNGKTIEVDNTDAEGRITLADVITYAEELKVDEIIDMATLTGACMVALGSAASAIMGNDQQMIDKLVKCGEQAGENLWQLPLYEEYKDSLKSDIADMKNTGSRYGGASIAGTFLQNFVLNKTPWAHIDIAGTAYLEKCNKLGIKAATGVGVRTLLNYILE